MLNEEEMTDVFRAMDKMQDRIIRLKQQVTELEKSQCTDCKNERGRGRNYMYGDYITGGEND